MSENVLHWRVVGYVSPGAEQWIKDCGGQVRRLSDDPPLVAVALAYDPAGKGVWSHGRLEHRQGLEFWSTGEIQEATSGINLLYQSATERVLAEYASAETTYLILPDEEYDPATKQVKEPGAYTTPNDEMERSEIDE